MKTKKFCVNRFLFFSLLLCCFVISSCKKDNLLDTENNNQIAWQQTTLDSVQIIAMTVSPNGEIFASSCGELYRSSDQGENWASLGRWCPRYFAIKKIGEVFLIGASGGARSFDNGASWESFSVSNHYGVDARSIAYDKTRNIYSGVFRLVNSLEK